MPKGVFARKCTCCTHTMRAAMEFKRATGTTQASVCAEFKVSADTFARHWAHHVSPMQKVEMLGGKVAIAELAAKARAEDRSLLDYFAVVRHELFNLFRSAIAKERTHDSAIISGRLLAVLVETGKLTGELRQQATAASVTVNNLNAVGAPPGDASHARELAAIVRCLRPFPEAQRAVLAVLGEDGRTGDTAHPATSTDDRT